MTYKPPLTMWLVPGPGLMIPNGWRSWFRRGQIAHGWNGHWDGNYRVVAINFILSHIPRRYLPKAVREASPDIWLIWYPSDYQGARQPDCMAVSVAPWGHPRYIISLEPWLTILEARQAELDDLIDPLPDAAE